jgi:S-adenosylmethionine:tRNA ribosyltransferase-isomerase
MPPALLHNKSVESRKYKEAPTMKQSPMLFSTAQNERFSRATPLDFTLSADLEAGEPPEERGLARDEVRLMVSQISNNQVIHTRFRQIGDFLEPGDMLVINTSGTLNAALPTSKADGTRLELHLSTHLPAHLWVVEMRSFQEDGKKTTRPFSDIEPGESFKLPGGATVTLHRPYTPGQINPRLWLASLDLPCALEPYLNQNGFPIRYKYVEQSWPLHYYQLVYATEAGSAEMPSAGRAFTPELITQLVARGIQIAPLLLHTGVSSGEEHEPPYEEYYRVPLETAHLLNAARSQHRRIIAVGTTVVRALETVTDVEGITHPGEGWTRLVIGPQHGISAVNALLTGLHEPQASHLAMLEALAGSQHLQISYSEALREKYLWHEFGDLHLLLP